LFHHFQADHGANRQATGPGDENRVIVSDPTVGRIGGNGRSGGNNRHQGVEVAMRYFTPDRWLRLQDVSTREAFDGAHAGWQEALAAYRAELDRVNDQFPPALSRFAHSVCLHDGVLVGSWLGDGHLFLQVRPEDGSDVVQLEYVLAGDPVVLRGMLPKALVSDEPGWAYDEVGMDETGTFTHDVLLRNGTELRLRFSHFVCSRVAPLLPVPAGLARS
jgi:hypothetical protein